MDFQELKQQAEQITKELKDKAPEELSLLVGSLSMIIKMMLGICETQINQIEPQTKQIEALTSSIKELQSTIKDLQRQIGMNSLNRSKPPSTDGYKKVNKNRLLREKTGRSVGGQKGHDRAHMNVPPEAMKLKSICRTSV